MPFKKIVLILSLFIVQNINASIAEPLLDGVIQENTVFVEISVAELQVIELQGPNPVLKMFRMRQKKNKRAVAALLAFPFPFGIVGLHRIYLGCAPYVPVAYIASLGGVFGILPFIDFCVLLLDKNMDRYSNNKKIFMWVN